MIVDKSCLVNAMREQVNAYSIMRDAHLQVCEDRDKCVFLARILGRLESFECAVAIVEYNLQEMMVSSLN